MIPFHCAVFISGTDEVFGTSILPAMVAHLYSIRRLSALRRGVLQEAHEFVHIQNIRRFLYRSDLYHQRTSLFGRKRALLLGADIHRNIVLHSIDRGATIDALQSGDGKLGRREYEEINE
jgi:hypothetical protein